MMIEIPGRLPGTNEILDAAKNNRYKYSRMKSEWTQTVAWLAKKLPAYNRVDITITWYEPNEKRDPDNIMGGQKFILDGLVMAGVIPNDTRKHIRSIKHIPELDRENPRVEVQIEEVGVNNFDKKQGKEVRVPGELRGVGSPGTWEKHEKAD